MNHAESSNESNGANWVIRIVIGLAVIGALGYGGMWFIESSRLSERVNDLIADTHDQVYVPLIQGPPTVVDWLEAAPEMWQPIIDSSADLVGTSAEDAHHIARGMRDAVVGHMKELMAFELRAYQVVGLLNSHPGSTLGQFRISNITALGTIAELDLNSEIDIADPEALARLFSSAPTLGGDYLVWDNDLALFQAIRDGHGPALLERIAEISEETRTLAESSREMSRSVRSQVAQSSLPEGQRTRMLSDWNDFASTVGGMVIPYEQHGRQFLVEYTRYVEYIMAEFEPDELRPDRLHEIRAPRSTQLMRLRSNIERAR